MRLVPRLTLSLLIPIGLVFALDTFLTLRSDLTLLDADLRRDDALLGHELAIAVEQIWHDRGEQAAFDLVTRWQALGSGITVRIIFPDDPPGTPRGPVTAEIPGSIARDAPPVQLRGMRGTEARFFTYVPIETGGPRDAALEVTESLVQEHAHLAARIPRKLGTVAAMVLLCGIVSWRVGVRVVGRPVEALIAKSKRIGAGDFSGPLALRGRGEFSKLAAEMNTMAEMLDASARRLAGESAARIAALEQLRHADRLTTVGKLGAGLAHELGTPLNVVSGRAQMIVAQEITEPEEIVRSARVIRDQADRMTRIVRQLLDFARRRADARTDTDLAKLARDTVGMLTPLAAKRGVVLRLAESEQPVAARLDAGQLQQALTNLVMNALQASSRGSTVTVRVATRDVATTGRADRAPGRYAVLEVEDQGAGIPADQLPAIFDPFFTTKPVGEGTGLGLAVVYGIVEEHDGWVEVASEPGRGSRFSVLLPTSPA